MTYSSVEVELTVLMPCLNEQETIATCISEALLFLKQNSINGEVLVSDNGSLDGSVEIAKSAGARVVFAANKGYGSALITGINAARGKYIVMGDADNSYDFLSLGQFIKHLRNQADLVVGNRFAGGILPGAMPLLHKYLGNPVLSTLGRVFFKSKINDFHCGLRGFRKDAIINLNLVSTGMEFASEMIVKATMAGLRIEQVPTILRPDGRSRRPHLRTWADGWRHLRFLLLYSPNWLFLYPGLMLTGVGAVATSRLSFGSYSIGSLVFDVNTLLVSVAMTIVGCQALWFAILSKAYGINLGLLTSKPRTHKVIEKLTLERIMVVSIAGFALGLAGLFLATSRWERAGWGPLEQPSNLRMVIPSVGILVISLHSVFCAWLLSIYSLGTKVRVIRHLESN